MKKFLIVLLALLLCACTPPNFIGDAPPVLVSSKTPKHFVLPARFAVVRTVYGFPQNAGYAETKLWEDLASRSKSLGSFRPLSTVGLSAARGKENPLIEAARQQRYPYLIVLEVHPGTGTADISLIHVGSGGVMAMAQAAAPSGGKRGFWGGRINNPRRLERVTLKIAKASLPVVEELLQGVAKRQR